MNTLKNVSRHVTVGYSHKVNNFSVTHNDFISNANSFILLKSQPPEQRFAAQLEQLATMGFINREANIQGKCRTRPTDMFKNPTLNQHLYF